MKNRRKAVQPFEIKKRKIDIFRNYEANGFEKNQRKFENFSTLISKKSSVFFQQKSRNAATKHSNCFDPHSFEKWTRICGLTEINIFKLSNSTYNFVTK